MKKRRKILADSIDSVIKSYEISAHFPKEVKNQASVMPEKVEGAAAKANGRHDLRKLRMVTIDGEDAKDLDDAVSLEKTDTGGFRLGVHIADVSHYVQAGTPLDKEALKRGTSVYLADRVIPMLPARLSNGICSLNPHVDRLSLTVFMDFDPTGKINSYRILESVINVDERMTYDNVHKILAGSDPDLCDKYAGFIGMFKAMEELALLLRERRMHRGSIDFDFDETKVVLDEKGMPADIKRYEITVANRIIEEFMLVCNETVAEHFNKAETPFIYRIHEDPDPDRIAAFTEFVRNLGLGSIGSKAFVSRHDLQDLLKKVDGTASEPVVSMMMLRSMQKAQYSHVNTGHYGLAAEYYCHFTSPIRRYPDLMIHRIMKQQLSGRLTKEKAAKLAKKLPGMAEACSERERAAESAERDVENIMKVEFMRDMVGDEFDAVISGVTGFGLFVELENTVEGLVHISDLRDDYYIYDEKRLCLTGERTRKTYRMGDPVRVRLIKADTENWRLDFALAGLEHGKTRHYAKNGKYGKHGGTAKYGFKASKAGKTGRKGVRRG